MVSSSLKYCINFRIKIATYAFNLLLNMLPDTEHRIEQRNLYFLRHSSHGNVEILKKQKELCTAKSCQIFNRDLSDLECLFIVTNYR